MLIDINLAIEQLAERRKIFVSEADLQLELAWTLRELYPHAKIRLEYCPRFDSSMHIDILLIINNKWIPIELKYKTRACTYTIDQEIFVLKNHSAKDNGCYLYLKDIQRIERIRECVSEFSEGYTIFITNDASYLKKPQKADCTYAAFSLENGIYKTGVLDWSESTGFGTKKGYEKSIKLSDQYHIEWRDFSVIDKSATGTFKILINKIS